MKWALFMAALIAWVLFFMAIWRGKPPAVARWLCFAAMLLYALWWSETR